MTTQQNLCNDWLIPNWPAIQGVHAVFTTRHGGYSRAPWNSMNLGDHVGDDPLAVAANRQLLTQAVALQRGTTLRPVFLQQVHGCDVQLLQKSSVDGQAFDACISDDPELACAIMVADCLPVLMAHQSGLVVGAAHAGWRGLAGVGGCGVLESLWQKFQQQLHEQGITGDLAAQTQVWLGPCIGPDAFEVGGDVRNAFVRSTSDAEKCFAEVPNQADKWLAHLAMLARLRFEQMGIAHIYGNDGTPIWCTFSNGSRFFSHRRDAAVLGSTGRMAACVWRS